MRRLLVPAVGAVLLLAGLVLLAIGSPTDFGWFAYAPQQPSAGFPGSVLLLDRTGQAGAAVAAVGLSLLAGAVGYRLGRRSAVR